MNEAQKIAAKLSDQQRLALVGVGAGYVSYLGLRHRLDSIPMYHQYDQSDVIRIRRISQFSRVCHALHSRGLLISEVSARRVTLTELGQAVFDLVVTDAEKEDIERQKRWDAQRAITEARDRRGNEWDDQNHSRIRANNDVRQKAWYETERLKKEIVALAVRHGTGQINDTNFFLDENRQLVTELVAQNAITEECARQSAIMSAEREAAEAG